MNLYAQTLRVYDNYNLSSVISSIFNSNGIFHKLELYGHPENKTYVVLYECDFKIYFGCEIN